MKILRKLITLSRISMLPLSLSVPIIGALSLRQAVSLSHLLALAGVGISAHFFGFVLNDLMDYTLDKQSPFRQTSPLITGAVKRWQAWVFVLIQIPIAVGLYQGVLAAAPVGLIWLGASVGLSVVYNLFSKWRWLPRILAEVALALSVALLGLSGAWVYTQSPPITALVYCVTLGFVLLLVNSVPSGLKDMQFDQQFGARSFVLSTGSTVSSDGQLTLSPFLRRYMMSLQLIITLLIIWLAFQYSIGWGAGLLLIALGFYAALHVLRLLRLQHIDELRQVVLFLGGFYNYFALVVLIWSYLPTLIQIVCGLVIAQLLSIPFRRAWSIYRSRNKTIART